jgi:pimeloyl-ACP methyl ester carboxylesterase
MPAVHANGIDIYYEICGSGPPLTLIMGLGCSARQWQWMTPVLAKSFKVITFDNRGVGRSGKPDMEYSTEMFADDTRALLDVLDIPRTHLFGVSVGGMIAQRFALKYPEMVDRLVLGCTMPSLFHLPPAPEDSETMQMSRVVSIEEGAEKMMSLFFSEGFFKEEPKRVTALKEVIMLERKEQGDDAFMLQLGAAMKHNTVDEAKNIIAPALVISGTKDPIVRVENARFLAGQIPDSTLVEITGGYHAFWVERFENACDIIKKFLVS